MNWVKGLIFAVLAGVAGYFLEPAVRPVVATLFNDIEEPAKPEVVEEKPVEEVSQPEVVEEETAEVAEVEVPEEEPEMPVETAEEWPEIPAWVAGLTPEQLPEKVTIKKELSFAIEGAEQPMVLPSGAPVTPLRVEGEELVVSPFAGPMEGRIAVMATDLVERLGNQPPPEPEPEESVAEEPAEDGSEVAEPTEEMAEEPAGSDAPAGEEGIVAAMQQSLKDGEISEFTFDQVVEWTAGEPEERDGETYDTGKAAYKAETIFGVKTIQAQALIKDGKVVKWIWPNSGMEIK